MNTKRSSIIRRRLLGLLRSERGSAIVELAMVVSFFGAPLLLGTGEMGLLAYDSIEVTNAANAGAYYGMRNSTFAANTTGMVSAAQAEAADFGSKVTVTPTTYYACSANVAGTQYTGSNAQSNATSGCTGSGNHALQFVQVTVSITVTPGIHLPGQASSFALTRTAVMEVEQ